MSKIFRQIRLASPIVQEVNDDDSDWGDTQKTLHIGNNVKESVHSYGNIVIKTLPNDSHKSKIEIDLTDVDSPAEELTIKLRKVQICDDNGNNAYIYILCSEAFEADASFVPPDGLGS